MCLCVDYPSFVFCSLKPEVKFTIIHEMFWKQPSIKNNVEYKKFHS